MSFVATKGPRAGRQCVGSDFAQKFSQRESRLPWLSRTLWGQKGAHTGESEKSRPWGQAQRVSRDELPLPMAPLAVTLTRTLTV